MILTSLQTLVDQVAASDTYKDTEFVTDITSSGKERLLFSNENPPDLYDPDIIINATDAEITIKPGVEL